MTTLYHNTCAQARKLDTNVIRPALKAVFVAAEVINAVAFRVDMGALEYKLAAGNAVQLAEQPFLQVWEKQYEDRFARRNR